MINSVTAINYNNEKIVMELRHPEKSGFNIKSITGIGPGTADLHMTEVTTNDGAIFTGARLPARDIVMLIDFSFNVSVEAARHKSYKFFPVKRPITLIFETDERTVKIEGVVEANEPVIFEQREYTQISIMCPYPYFTSEENVQTVFYGVDPMFEFPFSNESLTEPLINMGEIMNQTEEVVYYGGDADTGIQITINAIGPASMIHIYNVLTREEMFIDTDKLRNLTGSGITAGDEIRISTIKGSKYIRLVRAGVTYNILNCLSRNSSWFQLAIGDNIFAFEAEDYTYNLQFRIDHRNLYEGV